MVRVKTEEQACALIGTTWEKEGKCRTITRIENLRITEVSFAGDVYWKRPGGRERKQPQWLPYFNQWLFGAKKIEST